MRYKGSPSWLWDSACVWQGQIEPGVPPKSNLSQEQAIKQVEEDHSLGAIAQGVSFISLNPGDHKVNQIYQRPWNL